MGNGTDCLKLQVTLYSLNHNTTPQVNWINFQYAPGNNLTLNNDSTLIIAPNPYRPDLGNVSMRYFLNQPANVDIKIFTKDGLEIWDNSLAANQGLNTTQWDGTSNKYNKNTGSGAYFCLVIKTLSKVIKQ